MADSFTLMLKLGQQVFKVLRKSIVNFTSMGLKKVFTCPKIKTIFLIFEIIMRFMMTKWLLKHDI